MDAIPRLAVDPGQTADVDPAEELALRAGADAEAFAEMSAEGARGASPTCACSRRSASMRATVVLPAPWTPVTTMICGPAAGEVAPS